MNTLYYIIATVILAHIPAPSGAAGGGLGLLALLTQGYLLWFAKSVVEAGYLAASGLDMGIMQAIPRIRGYIAALALGSLAFILAGATGLAVKAQWLAEAALGLALLLGAALKLVYLPCLIYRESFGIEGCKGEALRDGFISIGIPIVAGSIVGLLIDLALAAVTGSPLVLSLTDPMPGTGVEPWRATLGEVVGVVAAAKMIAARIW